MAAAVAFTPLPAAAFLGEDDGQALVLDACVAETAGQGPGHARDACLGLLSDRCLNSQRGMTTQGQATCLRFEAAAWDRIRAAALDALGAQAAGADAAEAAARAELEAELAARAEAAGETPPGLPPAPPSKAETLAASAAAWEAYRDAECAHLHAAWAPGSIAQPVAAHCAMALTAERAIALRMRLQEEEAK